MSNQRPYGKTMSLSRKIDERRRLVSKVHDVYYWTRQGLHTSDWLRDRYKRDIYDDPAYPLLSTSDREYIRGVQDTIDSQLWREMVWRLGPESGPLPYSVDGWKTECHNGPCVLGDLSREPNALYGGHYWPGTDNAFTAYRCLNRPHCGTCHHDDVLHVDGGRCTDPYHSSGQCQCEAYVKA